MSKFRLSTLLASFVVIPTLILCVGLPGVPQGTLFRIWLVFNTIVILALLAWTTPPLHLSDHSRLFLKMDRDNTGYGAVLSDQSLRERIEHGSIVVSPLAAGSIQPASIDVRLGSVMKVFTGEVMLLGDGSSDRWEILNFDARGIWMLKPGACYLATTLETISVPDDLVCQLDGRSSEARRFVLIHQQAGWLDSGYSGRPTVEITVTVETELKPGQPIGQLSFFKLDQPAQLPYNGRYQYDKEPAAAKRDPRIW
jgi:dCTP deaminase